MIYPIRTIVAGIAELGEADPLLAPALELAERTGAVLHLVHAFELPDLVWDSYARMGYMGDEALREYAEGVRARLEEAARGAAPGGRVRCHAIAGPAAAMVQRVAKRENADLILVGATRRGTLARTILGTTAQRVLRGAAVPVLVLRGPLPARLRRVLLTTDLSPFSAGIHEIGLDVLESLYGGDEPELRSLMVVGFDMPPPPPLRPDLLDDAARRELERFLGERRSRPRPVHASVRFGDPAKEIVAEAADWEADLLVLGTHSRTTRERLLLGSVAEAAIRGAIGSALVIPARVEEQRILPAPLARAVEPPRAPTGPPMSSPGNGAPAGVGSGGAGGAAWPR